MHYLLKYYYLTKLKECPLFKINGQKYQLKGSILKVEYESFNSNLIERQQMSEQSL